MINTHAVLAQIDTLMAFAGEGSGSAAFGSWADGELQGLSVQRKSLGDAGVAYVLPGKDDRTVALGSYLPAEGRLLNSCVGLAVGMEALKALARRMPDGLPCSLQLTVWSGMSTGAVEAFGKEIVAYLELHAETGDVADANHALGMVEAAGGTETRGYNRRLVALGDEAIRELTGVSTLLPTGPVTQAATLAQEGTPAALMVVQQGAVTAEGKPSAETRLHLLQAAESFGRWVESTIHLVAGEDVDLWAREHRLPHEGM